MLTIGQIQKLYGRAINLTDLDLLIADTLHTNTAFVHTHPEKRLSIGQLWRIWYRAWQRRRGYSVAVILGHKEFFGLDFLVNKYTLIPRPNTELLVEEALKVITPDSTLIDVGTGSGCIPIAILSQKSVPAYATDISAPALAAALHNALRHRTTLQVMSGNLLAPLPNEIFQNRLVITANLPYLTQEQFDHEPSIQREPHSALVAEKNGLALYEELLIQLANKKCTQPITLLLEIDPAQPDQLKKMVLTIFPNAAIEIKNDLAQQSRLAIIKLNW